MQCCVIYPEEFAGSVMDGEEDGECKSYEEDSEERRREGEELHMKVRTEVYFVMLYVSKPYNNGGFVPAV